ncbi:DJ-1/PfpI family protein [Chondromyces apiculatus]|uniref:ThiJ/PfpI n=1 Tax=Chondromyces apiculatus DSM 436 TaxID=1192034 RepID=A0A017SWF6_9BACT|nr:DJ-1/PfpI family protein [Chondromyces apiculatus]EYF00636.1 ThiJ/PfpI [Chondromyces apiculatus DSM 436]
MTKTIAFLVYPNLTPLDLIGPLQVLKPLERFGPYRVVTVGERLEAIPSDAGLSLTPERLLTDEPHPFAIVVPGGLAGPIQAITQEPLMSWVRAAASSAEIVASVCTGSLILAAAGLLEGRRATTHWSFMDALGRLGAQPVRERWVEDGKFILAAGVSAGIDMALALVRRLTDETTARTIQTLIEYDPEPPLGGIDWGWVEQADLGRSLLAPALPELRRILAGHPDLARKLFP